MIDKNIKLKLQKLSPWFLVIFHIIGLIIFMSPDRITGLSWFNILFCTFILFLNSLDYLKEFFLLGFIYLGGMSIEILGVSTGVLFGTYSYGNELGYTIFGVPWVLGLNWYCIIVISSAIVLRVFPQVNLLIKSIIAATLCTFLDFIIEPVAIKNDFWYWENGSVPLYNYLCWFVFSFVFLLLYMKYNKLYNSAAQVLFFIWLIFFGILNFI